ncbi:MAG: HAD-IC family P-type ATPase, partial [Eubacteriales bacterium]|nr:HAD-IC family P-type ATPase [Eubacteriales bacterium]
MQQYLLDISSVLTSVSSGEDGLTNAEAQKRLRDNGPNKLAEGKKTPLIARFLEQMKDPMILILLAAALVSGITAAIEGESFADVIIILTVVIINAVLGVVQESKAEKAIEALQKMSAATCRVLREGQILRVKTEELVVGDVVLLEAGDAVPADGRILESASLQIEEAALTGESVPVSKVIEALHLGESKDIALGDRKNMIYMGSTVVYGRGKAVITAIGMQTEMGKIADAISKAEDNQTPLQIKLSQLSKILTWLVLGICVVIFGVNILRFHGTGERYILDSFLIAVSLAVAAIPEGLAAVVTIVLSIGVTNMSKRNAIIRRLTAVETLGCAQIICSDKTGTLTQNKMTVVEDYADDVKLLAKAMALCSDAELDDSNNAIGEPTECALVNFAFAKGLPKNELKTSEPRVDEAPFDSMRKMMSTVHQTQDGFVQYTKGAPDELLKKCTSYWKDGKSLPLTDEVRAEILAANKAMAGKALRVLSGAMRAYEQKPADHTPAALEQNLIFLGLVGMIEPVRPEVIDAISQCRTAGIRPIMITGDHRDTAAAIAMTLGIISDPSEAITGAQLDEMDDATFEQNVEQYHVYARVQPEHKVRIVNAWRKKGYITAMTGDGVNDAPSIKSADIGIGMGITGTDVTKNVADMVLADDNFATIVGAVQEGRRIYDNIRKSIQFLLSSNMSEVLSIFFATLLGFVILKPVHLLWINLITDSLPALALGTEACEQNLMQRPPRN